MRLAERLTRLLYFGVRGRNETHANTEQAGFLRSLMQFRDPSEEIEPIKIELTFGHQNALAHHGRSRLNAVNLKELPNSIRRLLSKRPFQERFCRQHPAVIPNDEKCSRVAVCRHQW